MTIRVMAPAAVFVGILVLWETVRIVADIPQIVLPSLYDIIRVLIQDSFFISHVGVTVAAAFAGFVLGNTVALIMAIAILRFRFLESGVLPYAIALKTTPVVAIAPILIIWFGGGWLSKAVAAAVVCFFPMLVNLVRGLRIVDSRDNELYRDLFTCWGARWWTTLIKLRFPFAMPLLFSALKISSSLALVGAIVAEFIAANRGLGFLIVVYSRRLETAHMFAALLVSTAIGVVWFYLIVIAERRFARRFGGLTATGELL